MTQQLRRIQSDAASGSWWSAVNAVVSLPISVLSNLVVARVLASAGYGHVASLIAAFTLGSTVCDIGVTGAVILWGARFHALEEREHLLELSRRIAGFGIFFKGPALAVFTAILLRHAGLGVILLAVLGTLISGALGATLTIMSAMSRNARVAQVSMLTGPALNIGVAVAALSSRNPDFTWSMRIALGTLAPVVTFAAAPKEVRRAVLRPLIPLRWPTGLLPYAARVFASGLVTTIVFSRTEVLVLNGYHLAAAAGTFALAAGIAIQITAPLDAMLGPLIPAVAGLLAVDRSSANAALSRGIRLSVVTVALLMAVVVPSIALLMPILYGSGFSNAANLFVWIGCVSCLQTVMHPCTAVVLAMRRPLTRLAINVAAATADIGLVWGLATTWGATAAVLGSSVGQCLALFGMLPLVRQATGQHPRATLRLLVPFVAAVAVTILCAYALLAVHGSTAVHIILAAASAVVTPCLVGVSLRLTRARLSEGDLDLLRRAVPRRLGFGVRVLSAASSPDLEARYAASA